MATLSVRTPNSSRVTRGTYTGNDAANRAIPHGLGSIPYLVVIQHNDAAYMGVLHYTDGYIHSPDAAGHYTVTAMDITNFYVGNATDYGKSMNGNTNSYTWTAFSV